MSRRYTSLDGVRAGGIFDLAVGPNWESGPHCLHHPDALAFCHCGYHLGGGAIAWRLCDPEGFEIGKGHHHVKATGGDPLKARTLKQQMKRAEAGVLGAWERRYISHGLTQPQAKRPARGKLSRKVPHIAGDDATWTRNATHFGQCARPVRDEIDDEGGGNNVECGVGKRQRLRIGDVGSSPAEPPACGGRDRPVPALDRPRTPLRESTYRESAR